MKRLSLTLTLLLTLYWAPSHAADYEDVEDRSQLEILNPSFAARETAKIRLPNGLEVLLLSDPDSDLSGAALAVEAGSWQDPNERPGLAHFCEHMLFLGSQAYPSEVGFRKFVDDHGGQFNAYTASRYTNYAFAVTHDHFLPALDRFSHFFIDPLFTTSALGREQRAVDQEFERTREHDGWRAEMVRKCLAHKGHPDSRFNCGNRETLQGVSSEEVRRWYEGHYSADLMHLVVLSPLPMPLLKEEVAQRFGAVPKRKTQPFQEPLPQMDPLYCGSMVYLEPHLDLRQLTLLWELPYNYERLTESHAAELIAFVLGHEGPGSLAYSLKKEGWIESLAAGSRQYNQPETQQFQFLLSLSLTESGVEERESVIARIFEAIRFLHESGVPRYIYDEVARMNELDYAYQSRSSVYQQVESRSSGLVQEPLTTYPRLSLLASHFDPQAVRDLLERMTPQRCYFSLQIPAERLSRTYVEREPWTGTLFAVEALPAERLLTWSQAVPDESLALPQPNPFLPESLDLLYLGKPESGVPQPLALVDTPYGRLYYSIDRRFQVPQLYMHFDLLSGAVQPGNARDAVLADLLARAIEEQLNPLSYAARLAGLEYAVLPNWHGLTLRLSGYSDKAPRLLSEIVRQIVHVEPNQEAFSIYKSSLARSYHNAERTTPLDQALEVSQEVVYRDFVSPEARHQALENLELEDLIAFRDNFRKQTYLRGLLYGNLTEEGSAAIWERLHVSLQEEPLEKGAQLHQQVVELPQARGPFFVEQRIPNRGQAALLAIQEGDFSFELRAMQQILSTAIETPFFDELRTKQQTGYVVHSWGSQAERQLFQYFAVQSNSHDSRDLLARFELVVEEFLQHLTDLHLPRERFEAIRSSWIERLRQPITNQTEMGDLLFLLAFEREGDFHYLNKRIAAMEALEYDRFIELAHHCLGKHNKRRLGILISGDLPREATLQYERAPSCQRLSRYASYR